MPIHFDFPFILTAIVLISGFIALLDKLFLAKRRVEKSIETPWYIEYANSFFPILFTVLIIRSFIIQPYRVPTGSLEPTVAPGDFILVNQFAYGLRLPVLNTKIYAVGEPKLGDIVLFHWPVDTSIIFVKRVIGTPGDHVVYQNKQLTINGKIAPQKEVGLALDYEITPPAVVHHRTENLPNGINHSIFIRSNKNEDESFDLIVPDGEYFMMGDNRDNSGDSRYWGFVPEENLIGKVFASWMSWDSINHTVRWERIGKKIQ